MEINSTAGISASLSQAQTGDAVAVSVLKKALDIQASSAEQLIQALPQTASTALSVDGLGQKINTFA